MKNFVFGTIFGIVIATVGINGVATLFDKGVSVVREQAKELTRN